MDDCISRQAVKDWLKRWDGYLDQDMIARMQLKVADIPTHPTPSNTLGTLDCVDRQKAIRNICNQDCHQPQPCKWKCIAIDELEALPSVQPEIIRCKDCEWWDKQEMSLQGRCSLLQMYPTGEWYCGNAKLRSNSE